MPLPLRSSPVPAGVHRSPRGGDRGRHRYRGAGKQPSLPGVASRSRELGSNPPRAAFPRGAPIPSRLAVESKAAGREPEVDDDARLADTLRAVPLVAGGIGILGTLANRLLSGIAPVVDASSSQSRADVLVIAMSAVLLLTGLQWLSLKPKAPVPVELFGDQAHYFADGLPSDLKEELKWAYGAVSSATAGRALVVVHRGKCLCHLGFVKKGEEAGSSVKSGPICDRVMETGKGNYLANLALFPGRLEFTAFLPSNTQGVAVQPVGKEGFMVVASDTARSFSLVDQAWLSVVAEKLDVTIGEERQSTGTAES